MNNKAMEFKSAERLVEYIKRVCTDSGLIDTRVKFPADVTGVSTSGNWVYITISQEYDERYFRNVYKRKLNMSLLANKNDFLVMVKRLGMTSTKDFTNKKWEIQGKLSFFKPKAQFSVFIDTIAPIGESELKAKRREIYLALKAKKALMPVGNDIKNLPPIKRIAVISSKKAAGYGDFLNNIMLEDKYKPVIHLYDSFMQGSSTVKSVIQALNLIYACPIKYDIIVLTRGGGAASDLMYFDDYELGMRIAKFNKEYCPVLSAIGHEKDSTIPDFVSWQKFDTPTAVAKAITDQIKSYINLVDESWSSLNSRLENWFVRAENILSPVWLEHLEGKTNEIVSLGRENIEKTHSSIDREFGNTVKESKRRLRDYDLQRLGTNLELSVSIFAEKMDEIFLRMGTFLESKMKLSTEVINQKYSPYMMHMNSILTEQDYSLGSLRNSVKDQIKDIETKKRNALDKVSDQLIEHGGFAASLLFGGVVLKKGKKIAKSVKDIEVDDVLENYFMDGVAESKITKIK